MQECVQAHVKCKVLFGGGHLTLITLSKNQHGAEDPMDIITREH